MSNNNRKNIYIYALAILFIILITGFSYASTSLEELKRKLKSQESAAVKAPAAPAITPAGGNMGTIYSVSGSAKEEAVPLVYITPEIQKNIDDLYKTAQISYNNGDLSEAKNCLEEIISLNPLHMPARSFMERILDKEAGIAERNAENYTEERILDVQKAWLPPIKEKEAEKGTEQKQSVKSEQQLAMEKKASQIIPEINFTDAQLRDVLKYLSDLSGINIIIDEDLFPKTRIKEEVPEKIELDKTSADFAQNISKGTEPAAVSGISDRITISLTNIPLVEALKYILSAKGLKYRIDEYAIIVSTPERLAGVDMETRYYHLSSGVGIFTEYVKKVREEESKEVRGVSKGLKAKSRITIKDVLEQSGVPFPPGSKVFLDKRTGVLIVRNTPQNMTLVEEVLRILDIAPFQVEIEARFIEVSQDTAQELGLEWTIKGGGYFFGSGKNVRWDVSNADAQFGQYPVSDTWNGDTGLTKGLRFLSDVSSLTGGSRNLPGVDNILDSGGRNGVTSNLLSGNYSAVHAPESGGDILSISGILTNPQFRMILHALDESGCTNVLCAPKVITLNNQQAQIEVVKEIIYPTEFELTPATTNEYGTIVTQPVVTPSSWTTRDIGVILNVTPSVGADRRTVHLSLSPEVSVLKGWDNYGIPSSADFKGKAGTSEWNEIPILQPRFYSKKVSTNVVINDGETVVLGGLIKEETVSTEDKIPVLGDIPFVGTLFRSETEQSRKTNLLIFVTANLLTPSGERIKR